MTFQSINYCKFQGEDRQELKRHIFADIADRAALRKLLNRVFQPCKCNRLQELESSVFGVRNYITFNEDLK